MLGDLFDQLKIGGKIVSPVGHKDGFQTLYVITKNEKGHMLKQAISVSIQQ
jgi:protein-L-isoaspartate O-methyltransferase